MTPTLPETRPTPDEVALPLREAVAEILGCAADQLDPERPFTSYGMSSIEGVALMGDLEDWLDLERSASLFWDYPTLTTLTAHLRAAVAGAS